MTYMVIRGDDNGHSFIIKDGLSHAEALELYKKVSRGHKQWYSIVSWDTPDDRAGLVSRCGLKE